MCTMAHFLLAYCCLLQLCALSPLLRLIQAVVVDLLFIINVHECFPNEQALMANGVSVVSLEDSYAQALEEDVDQVLYNCLKVNEALLHRAATKRPLSVLKYAMTLDGKIAASTGTAG